MDSTLTNKKRKIRKIVGVISITVMILGVFALKQRTDPGEYHYKLLGLLTALEVVWLVFSLTNKIIMVMGNSSLSLSILSLVFFAVFVFSVFLMGKQVTPYQRPLPYELLCGLWILGWPFVDLGCLLNVF